MDGTETQIRSRVASFAAAAAAGDEIRAHELREQVAVLCYDEVSRAALRLFGASPGQRDDVISIAQMVFFETLPAIMTRFDPDKVATRRDGSSGTFAGWVLREGTSWHRSVGKELGLTEDQSSRNGADQQMLRIYHGCREGFVIENGRPWTPQEAVETIGTYLREQTTARILRKRPGLTETELEAAVHDRIRKDGHHRTLRQLADIVRAEESSRTLSLDAPLTADGSATLADMVPGEEDDISFVFDDLQDWTKVAVLGMTRRDARLAVKQLGAVGEDEPLDANVAVLARRNMVNPVAQFVVLGGVESQFEDGTAGTAARTSVRELLVAAANLR